MEKFCPNCGRVYPDPAATECEADGERLVVLHGEPDLVGTTVEDKYTVRAKLGEGGMGTVYLAEQTSMGREVAVKVLRPQYSRDKLAIKRFLREARASSRLAHPNTITVYDSGQTADGLLYQVMERLTGRPLCDLLDEEGALEAPRAIHILAQVCDSLSEAHEQGVVHRDLKPENIFIEEKAGNPEFVKVLDFGIAKMSEENVTQATATGMICGTPSYMSPEQTMGRELDGRSDLYALGILFWEMLSGLRPFEGDSPMEVMLKHINEPPPELPEGAGHPWPAAVERVLAWMLAKDVDERPADGQELKAALLAILDQPPEAEGDAPMPLARRSPEAREGRGPEHEKTGLSPALTPDALDSWNPPTPAWQVWLAVAATVIALVGGGAWWWSGGLDDPATPEDVQASAQAVSEAGERSGGIGEPDDEATTPEAAMEAAAVEPRPMPAAAGATTGVLLGAAGARSAEAWLHVPPKTVGLRVSSQPPGAEVRDADGELLGKTPLVLERPADAGPLELTVKRRGYRSETVVLDPEGSPEAEVSLQRIRRRSAKPPRSAKPAPPVKAAPEAERKDAEREEPGGEPSFGTF